MSVRILEGVYDRTRTCAVMVDSVTERAFGPLFEDAEEVEAFIAYFRRRTHGDPRSDSREVSSAFEAFRRGARAIVDEAEASP